MKLFSPSVLLIISFFSANTQDLPLGSWRVHLPYLKATKVAEAGDRIYCVADKGLYFFNKKDQEVGRMSKVEGLSDNDIDLVSYSADQHALVIAYSNANIDLVFDDQTIVNVPDIQRANITGNKKNINHVMMRNQYAYLSCGFGIVVMDLQKKEIKETYFLGSTGTNPAIYGLCTDDQANIYVASDSGVYTASLNNPALNDFASWSKIYSGPGVFNQIIFFGGRLLVNQVSPSGADTLWSYQGGTWSGFNANDYVSSLRECYGTLVIAYRHFVRFYDTGFNPLPEINGNLYQDPQAVDALFDKDHIIWIADELKGLGRYNGTDAPEFIVPNGPKSVLVSSFDATGNQLWVAHGPVAGGGILVNQYVHGSVSSYSEGTWKSYYRDNTNYNIVNLDSTYDFTSIIADQSDEDHLYAGSFNRGVVEFNDGDVTAVYGKNNTGGVLQYINDPGTDFVRVGGMALDAANRLWVAVAGVPNMLNVKKEDGTWKGFSFPGLLNNNNYFGPVIIDDFGQKWCIDLNLNDNVSMFVFNDNNTLDDLSDDKARVLTTGSGQGALPSSDIRAMAKDRDGSIWVGTSKGVVVFYSPGSVVTGTGNFDAQQVLIQFGGYNQYLLETEIVTAVAIDGANRKWFGTQNGGVFLMSPDGTKQLANFNISNSPLLSNNVLRISINKTSGEVFFGTDKGIISYRGTATEGSEGCEGTYVYPNPITENYEGPIAVKGLAANSNVKITDAGGTVIYETKAEGGQAIWNGRSLNGTKARTGVYLVFCSDETGANTCVTKMVFVN